MKCGWLSFSYTCTHIQHKEQFLNYSFACFLFVMNKQSSFCSMKELPPDDNKKKRSALYSGDTAICASADVTDFSQ